MDWRERLKSVAVIGAGGKMGSGIAWVALKAMADLDALSHGSPGSGEYELVLIDADRKAFGRLREYLRGQLLKNAEKNISELRAWAKDRAELIENGEIIEAYVDGALAMARWGTEVAEAASARIVFEAVFEDAALKRELYAGLKSRCSPETIFLTNTSSIPISQLDESAGLDGRLLGFHFYNPPAIQKLVELIPGKRTRPEAIALGKDLGKAFGKTIVASKDVAGFIGNGHFIRELLFALEKYRELRKEWSEPEAWYLLNRTTQDFLVRPMGIVQLMDYVGLDVFQMIAKVMREHLPAKGNGGSIFADATLDALLAAGIKGGQRGSGEQKDGLLRYERNKPAGVLADALASEGNRYVSLTQPGRFAKADAWLGEPPSPASPPAARISWSHLSKDPGKAAKLSAYFGVLKKAPGNGARLAREFLDHSRIVAEDLVRDGVAASLDDVGQVLKLGFFHLYGPADWGQG
ncbi:MAG: 3-hydroxyacyl-CoA dehydrogenase family protein [Fibrobacteres bacterium]|nr:3-hydroxyacyl-CoA dehydrogenase family protein [Fibrobacterota bacterium]